MRGFRRTLQAIVLAGLPVAGSAGCSLVGEECGEMRRAAFLELRGPFDAPMTLRLESCHLDADACDSLCSMALGRAREKDADLQGGIAACEVSFVGDTAAKGADLSMVLEHYVRCEGDPVDGRRPTGLLEREPVAMRSRAAAWLAHSTWLEAASIYAFVELARELEQRGAPAALVRAALHAARDEVRHTELMGGLALRYGAELQAPKVTPMAPRSLEAMATDNAIEGCVRETWGALCAMWQAQTALDVEARRVYTEISRDEIRHAQLAWAIDAWLAPRLDEAARERVAAARAQAVRELFDGDGADGVSERRTLPALGLPDALQARGLLQRASHSLWNGAIA